MQQFIFKVNLINKFVSFSAREARAAAKLNYKELKYIYDKLNQELG